MSQVAGIYFKRIQERPNIINFNIISAGILGTQITMAPAVTNSIAWNNPIRTR